MVREKKKQKQNKTLIYHLYCHKLTWYRNTQYTILQYLHYIYVHCGSLWVLLTGRAHTYIYDDNKSTTWLECVLYFRIIRILTFFFIVENVLGNFFLESISF